MPSTLRHEKGEKNWNNFTCGYCFFYFNLCVASVNCISIIENKSGLFVHNIFNPNIIINYFLNFGTEHFLCGDFVVDCLSEDSQPTTNFRPTVRFPAWIQTNSSMAVYIFIDISRQNPYYVKCPVSVWKFMMLREFSWIVKEVIVISFGSLNDIFSYYVYSLCGEVRFWFLVKYIWPLWHRRGKHCNLTAGRLMLNEISEMLSSLCMETQTNALFCLVNTLREDLEFCVEFVTVIYDSYFVWNKFCISSG